MGRSRGQKVKSTDRAEADIFWMTLEEAKQAIGDKYEFLVDQYERRSPKKPA
jgi:hypothetical protein